MSEGPKKVRSTSVIYIPPSIQSSVTTSGGLACGWGPGSPCMDEDGSESVTTGDADDHGSLAVCSPVLALLLQLTTRG